MKPLARNNIEQEIAAYVLPGSGVTPSVWLATKDVWISNRFLQAFRGGMWVLSVCAFSTSSRHKVLAKVLPKSAQKATEWSSWEHCIHIRYFHSHSLGVRPHRRPLSNSLAKIATAPILNLAAVHTITVTLLIATSILSLVSYSSIHLICFHRLCIITSLCGVTNTALAKRLLISAWYHSIYSLIWLGPLTPQKDDLYMVLTGGN